MSCGPAQTHAAAAIDLHFAGELILILFGFLQDYRRPIVPQLLLQACSHLFLPCVQFFDRNQPFFVEQLDQAVDERGCLEHFRRAGIQTAVRVQKAPRDVFPRSNFGHNRL